MEDGQHITLYVKDGCFRCKFVKLSLDKYDVSYEEVKDESIIEEKEYEQLPIMDVDGKEMEYNQILYWMKEHGLYSPSLLWQTKLEEMYGEQ